jgi:integrase
LSSGRRLLDSGTVSRRTVNKLITNVHGIFERACDSNTWGLTANPVKDVKRLKEHYDPGKYDFFSKEEVWALVRAARERTRGMKFDSATHREAEEFLAEQDAAIFLTAAFTGMRMGEVLGLRWRDVDFDNELIRVTQQLDDLGQIVPTKGKRVRVVPMVSSVARHLAALSQHGLAPGDDDPVFVGVRYAQRFIATINAEDYADEQNDRLIVTRVDRSALAKRYAKARKAAGLDTRLKRRFRGQEKLVPLTFHDLRHTFGSLAANHVESMRELQDQLGHADYRTTERYTHHRQRADAARRLAPAFEEESAELEAVEAPA